MIIVWKKLKKQHNFYAKEAQIRSAFFTNKSMILLMYKEAYFNTNDLDYAIPSVAIPLLQEFDDVIPEDITSLVDIPPLRGIKHQIDLYRWVDDEGVHLWEYEPLCRVSVTCA